MPEGNSFGRWELMPRSIDTAELSEVAIVTMALNTQASRRKPKSDAIIHQ
jgi:hypothetical protein